MCGQGEHNGENLWAILWTDMTIILADLQRLVDGSHIWYTSASLSQFPSESQIDRGNGSRPRLCVWCGQERGAVEVGTWDLEQWHDSAQRPGTVMPLCKWTAFPSSWFSAWFSCKCKSELRREREHDLGCLHLSVVWDAFFKREGQTSNDLRVTLACQSNFFCKLRPLSDAKPLWKSPECRLSSLPSGSSHLGSCLEMAQNRFLLLFQYLYFSTSCL